MFKKFQFFFGLFTKFWTFWILSLLHRWFLSLNHVLSLQAAQLKKLLLFIELTNWEKLYGRLLGFWLSFLFWNIPSVCFKAFVYVWMRKTPIAFYLLKNSRVKWESSWSSYQVYMQTQNSIYSSFFVLFEVGGDAKKMELESKESLSATGTTKTYNLPLFFCFLLTIFFLYLIFFGCARFRHAIFGD